MLKIEKTKVHGWEAAIRGMRNPLCSWARSDSVWHGHYGIDLEYDIGENDLTLMKNLAAAGTDHAKFMRMINVTCDITSSHFWYFEFDTYKVGTVKNSCSKMHRIHVKSFEPDDFSHEGIDEVGGFVKAHFEKTLEALEKLRKKFNDTQQKKYWRAMLELLPMGYNIRATVMLNYAALRNIYHARRYHKLDEWREFCRWIETLPYSELITMEGK